ncbi:hypothetical protein [Natronococcus wangiae]|uniref:hypothetical protein n=1 Tax=Natronococcus wangiae TaxID=3068275 RepID=UPI00273EEDED|nr:hypothetical protein [Natronococcus sp. AD5]
MSDPDGDQWSAERMQAELETVLVALRTLEDQLAEPLCLANSIIERETTLAAYDQTDVEAASDA